MVFYGEHDRGEYKQPRSVYEPLPIHEEIANSYGVSVRTSSNKLKKLDVFMDINGRETKISEIGGMYQDGTPYGDYETYRMTKTDKQGNQLSDEQIEDKRENYLKRHQAENKKKMVDIEYIDDNDEEVKSTTIDVGSPSFWADIILWAGEPEKKFNLKRELNEIEKSNPINHLTMDNDFSKPFIGVVERRIEELEKLIKKNAKNINEKKKLYIVDLRFKINYLKNVLGELKKLPKPEQSVRQNPLTNKDKSSLYKKAIKAVKQESGYKALSEEDKKYIAKNNWEDTDIDPDDAGELITIEWPEREIYFRYNHKTDKYEKDGTVLGQYSLLKDYGDKYEIVLGQGNLKNSITDDSQVIDHKTKEFVGLLGKIYPDWKRLFPKSYLELYADDVSEQAGDKVGKYMNPTTNREWEDFMKRMGEMEEPFYSIENKKKKISRIDFYEKLANSVGKDHTKFFNRKLLKILGIDFRSKLVREIIVKENNESGKKAINENLLLPKLWDKMPPSQAISILDSILNESTYKRLYSEGVPFISTIKRFRSYDLEEDMITFINTHYYNKIIKIIGSGNQQGVNRTEPQNQAPLEGVEDQVLKGEKLKSIDYYKKKFKFKVKRGKKKILKVQNQTEEDLIEAKDMVEAERLSELEEQLFGARKKYDKIFKTKTLTKLLSEKEKKKQKAEEERLKKKAEADIKKEQDRLDKEFENLKTQNIEGEEYVISGDKDNFTVFLQNDSNVVWSMEEGEPVGKGEVMGDGNLKMTYKNALFKKLYD